MILPEAKFTPDPTTGVRKGQEPDTRRCILCGYMRRHHYAHAPGGYAWHSEHGDCPDLLGGISKRERIQARKFLLARATHKPVCDMLRGW